MNHQEATGHKATGCYQRWPLQGGEAHDGMARGAPAGISGTEAHQKTANYKEYQAFKRKNVFCTENGGWHQLIIGGDI